MVSSQNAVEVEHFHLDVLLTAIFVRKTLSAYGIQSQTCVDKPQPKTPDLIGIAVLYPIENLFINATGR